MSHYRRDTTPGATWFFTVVSYRRRLILCTDSIRAALRAAIEKVRVERPFTIDAWVLLPDHLHCLWTLPDGDADFSTRWKLIKHDVSLACGETFHRDDWMTALKRKHREATIWQRRFWDHRIRNEADFARHFDYLHFNPVKHGVVENARDWPYSAFHRHVRNGIYPLDWGGPAVQLDGEYGEHV